MAITRELRTPLLFRLANPRWRGLAPGYASWPSNATSHAGLRYNKLAAAVELLVPGVSWSGSSR